MGVLVQTTGHEVDQVNAGRTPKRPVPHDYQRPLIKGAWSDLAAGQEEVVLAGAPSAGKTLMAWWLIEKLVKAGKRVLVLVHNQHVLATQFFQDSVHFPGLKVARVEGPADAPGALDAEVVIAIPSSLRRRPGAAGKFDVAVVDEAHDFYHPKQWQEDGERDLRKSQGMVQDILRATGARERLLLTGTPSVFVKRELPIHAVSLFQLLELGRAADIMVEMAASRFDWTKEDWNEDGNLRGEVAARITRRQTAATLDAVLAQLVARARDLAPWWNRAAKKMKLAEPLGLPETLGRGIIFCASIRMADWVGKLLSDRRIENVVSHSGNDTKSENIANFRDDRSVRVLVVADRCRIGFNLPELIWAADFTGTREPNLQFQMLCRLTRKADGDPKKLFLKAAPLGMEHVMRAWLEAALNLGDDHFYRTWDGRMPNSAVVRQPRKPREEHGEGSTADGQKKEDTTVKLPAPPPEGMFIHDFMRDVKHHHADPLAVTHMTTLGGARASLGQLDRGYYQTWEDALDKLKRVSNLVPVDPSGPFPGSQAKVEFRCPAGHVTSKRLSNAYLGVGCSTCSGLNRSHAWWKQEIEKHGKVIYLTEGSIPHSKDRVLCRCVLCGAEKRSVAQGLRGGGGLGCCKFKYVSLTRAKTGKVISDNQGRIFGNLAGAAAVLGIDCRQIHAALTGRAKTSRGLTWRYLTKKEAAAWRAAGCPEKMP